MKSSRCLPGMALLWVPSSSSSRASPQPKGQNTGSITGKVTDDGRETASRTRTS